MKSTITDHYLSALLAVMLLAGFTRADALTSSSESPADALAGTQDVPRVADNRAADTAEEAASAEHRGERGSITVTDRPPDQRQAVR